MGYYTNYALSCSKPGLVQRLVEQSEEDGTPLHYAIDTNGEPYDALKWYDHVDDMRAISLEHKGVLFTLEGKGEESGDLWRKYFLNGKMQSAPGVVTFDTFDSEKLT